jgi:dipeptidyl-peptidase-4
VYPDKNHSIYGGNTRLHLYKKMTNFLDETLGDKLKEATPKKKQIKIKG